MPVFGRYWNDDPWVHNPITGTGVRIASMTPQSDFIGVLPQNGLPRIVNGAHLNWGITGGDQGPYSQGIDNWDFSSSQIGYNQTLNVDPGPAGRNAPLDFLPGEEATVLKAVSKGTPSSITGTTQVFDHSALITIVAEIPPALAFRPPMAVAAKIHRWVMDDMDLTGLRNLPLVTGFNDPIGSMKALSRKQNVEGTARPPSEQMGASYHESTYGSDSANAKATAACYLSMNIDPAIKEKIAAAFCQIGIDTMARLKIGGVYNFNSGLGGILAGYKLPVLLAGIFLNDAEMLSWADKAQHDVFAEDRQTFYVTQPLIDAYDWVQDDLGMPEWTSNRVRNTAGFTRAVASTVNKSYRGIFLRHLIGQTMAVRLIPGAREAWNNQAFFDLADRYVNNNTIYKNPLELTGQQDWWGSLDWGRVGFGFPAPREDLHGANAAPENHCVFHDAYRTESGTGARWTWPEEWVIEGSMILQAPTPPTQPIVVDNRIEE